jgi:manganese/zinc/iron transport system permease protein
LAADRVVRNHRLWELFLIRHADIAASHVDRDADLVEHVLGEESVAELEQVLARGDATPQSPHPLGDDL